MPCPPTRAAELSVGAAKGLEALDNRFDCGINWAGNPPMGFGKKADKFERLELGLNGAFESKSNFK